MKHFFKKPYVVSALVLGLLFAGSLAVRVGFAWTNPTVNPPFGTPTITTSGGNIGIGTAPSYKLDVNGDANATRLCIAGNCQSLWPSASVTWAGVTNKTLGDTARNDLSFDIGISQYLRWKNYGNGHAIIDASNGTAPSGAGINNTNSDIVWSATYPTLMGWNGVNTYGVRVDSARAADRLEGKHWVSILNSSVIMNNNQSVYVPLRAGETHRYYRYSVYSNNGSVNVVQSYVPIADLRASAYIERGSTGSDYLVISNRSSYSAVMFKYSVDVWE